MTASIRESFRADARFARSPAYFSSVLAIAVSGCTASIDEPGGGAGVGGFFGGRGGAASTAGASNAGDTASSAPTAGTAGAAASAGSGSGGEPPVSTSGGAAGASSRPPGFKCANGTVDPGPAPLLRLSRSQYLNTVRDLVGEVPNLADSLASASEPSSFGLQQPDPAQVELEQYQAAANTIAAALVASSSKLNALVPCAAGSAKRDCAGNFLRSFASRAYRAPLGEADDIANHLALYDAGAKVSHEHGLELLLRGILQSPRFLYRVELGSAEKVSASAVKLSQFELATRLSYAVWDTLPDDELTRAASSGSLGSKAEASAQLVRMLADARGKTLVRRFLERFIRLGNLNNLVKDAAAYPDWSSVAIRDALRAQASAFFDDVLTRQNGSLSALLTSPEVFTNQALASYYGASTASVFSAVAWNPSVTSGLLTLPALLALGAKPNESSPIYRGKFVRESLFCQELPAPPPDVPKPPEVTPGVSTRERLAQHEADLACRGCHTLMDPIGFGFENYDAVGRYRATDGGAAIDASGQITGTAEIDGPFRGAVELGQKLAGSALVKECVTRQWFRFMLQRFEQEADSCSMLDISSAFLAEGASLNALPRALVESDAFLYRRPL
jgi:hypothetical protein